MSTAMPPGFATLSWSSETPLTTNTAADFQPDILQATDERIWVVWSSYKISSTNPELFYKTSTDGGFSWSTDARLTSISGNDVTPAIMQSQNGTIWVFWAWAPEGSSDYNIFYKTTSNNGLSWSSGMQLTDDPAKDLAPTVMQAADGKIWVVLTSWRTSPPELFYKTSSDNGLTWTSDTQLTFASTDAKYPSIYQTKDGTIWLTWAIGTTSQSNIYYKTSSNNGVSWSTEIALTSKNSIETLPSITQAKDSTIWILWDSDRNKLPGNIAQTDLYYNVYSGGSWLGETRFTSNESDDTQGCIAQGKTDLFITWSSSRLGNFDVFFTQAFVPVHDVAVTEVKPYTSFIYSGYPRKINVTVANHGTFTETFGVSVYRNGTLVGTQTATSLVPEELRTLAFIWDATGLPTGNNYTLSATAAPVSGEIYVADNSLTDGVVRVKIPGDINGDNVVNVYDAILLSTNFSQSPLDYPDLDINGDNYINVLDAIILTQNWTG